MIYVLLADGFEEIEAIEPIDILRRCGIDVLTASVMGRKEVEGAHSINVVADMHAEDINPENMDLLFLPGGGKGHELLDASNTAHALINYAVANGKYIAAICAAPSILGRKQLLDGKKATCYPGFEKYLYGAECVSDKVVVDGKIITGKGAGAAAEFGFVIAELLKDISTADEIKAQMQY